MVISLLLMSPPRVKQTAKVATLLAIDEKKVGNQYVFTNYGKIIPEQSDPYRKPAKFFNYKKNLNKS